LKRAVSIGNLTFDKIQYYDDEFKPQGVSAESNRTINGGVIVYEQLNHDSAKDVTLTSGENYPIGDANLQALKDMIDTSLGQTYTVTFKDGSTQDVRFKHEDNVLEIEPAWEGSCLFFITLHLAMV
jgi:hypothetical protein